MKRRLGKWKRLNAVSNGVTFSRYVRVHQGSTSPSRSSASARSSACLTPAASPAYASSRTCSAASAARSTDPDGDALAFKWFIYPEPGTYDGEVELQGAGSETARFVAPRVDEPATIHVVLQTTDDGDPSLHSFRRAVVTVKPG